MNTNAVSLDGWLTGWFTFNKVIRHKHTHTLITHRHSQKVRYRINAERSANERENVWCVLYKILWWVIFINFDLFHFCSSLFLRVFLLLLLLNRHLHSIHVHRRLFVRFKSVYIFITCLNICSDKSTGEREKKIEKYFFLFVNNLSWRHWEKAFAREHEEKGNTRRISFIRVVE